MRHLVLFGPPGSGKGTQAALLVERLGAHHLSTGRRLREAIAAGTPLGRQAQGAIQRGLLVPDETVNALVRECLASLSPATPAVLFDGYPRSRPQAEALEALLGEAQGRGVDRVILIEISDAEVNRRLAGRRECPRCGGIFNVVSAVPSDGSDCPECHGTLLRQREDDQLEAIVQRLTIYHRETAPVLDFYRGLGVLARIDGVGEVAAVHSRVMEALGDRS